MWIPTVSDCKTCNGNVITSIKDESSSSSCAVDNDSIDCITVSSGPATGHCRPCPIRVMQVVYIVDLYKICAVKAVLTIQKDESGVRGEVVAMQARRCSGRGCGISGVEDMIALDQHHQL